MKDFVVNMTADGYKKFGTFVIILLVLIFRESIGIDAEQATELRNLAMAYLIAQGIADFGKGKAIVENGKRDDN
jgi:hypothetical protein